MTTTQQNSKKASKKSQISIAYKTDASRKSLNHKEKIVNAIKKSTLKSFQQPKPRKSIKSRNSISNTDQKKKLPSYQIQSQRNRTNKTMSSISRTVPVKNSKQKLSEFPFEAIKFKNHPHEEIPNQNKTHDEFYIRYDEPQLGQVDMKVLQNSKKITGSHNQRIGRYSQHKARSKMQYVSGVKNIQFKQSVIKLFRFLDPHGTHVISHGQIDYRKVPQAVLYFLGGLFQRIRQKKLYLSQKEFQQECDQIYLKSSNDDVNWFIEEVKLLTETAEQRPKQMSDKIVMKNAQTEGTRNNVSQQLRVQENIEVTKQPNYHQSSLRFNNLSFEQESSVISFRKESKQSPIIFQGRQSKASHPSEKGSQKSAQFGLPTEHHRFSFSGHQKISFGYEIQKDKSSISMHPDSVIEDTISLAELQQMEMKNQSLRTGIKKNHVEKVQDMREQIYAKLDKLKISTEVKGNNLLRDNFKVNSGRDALNLSSNREQPKQNIRPDYTKNYRYIDNFNTENKPIEQMNRKKHINITQKSPLLQKKENNQIIHQRDEQRATLNEQRQKREWKQTKDSGWVNQAQGCEKAFSELQKIRDQFNKHKNTIQLRQVQRQNHFKDQSNKKTSKKNQDFTLHQQTRVLKLSSNRLTQQKLFAKQNKENPSYQRNIDRLSNLSNSRDRNPMSINLNDNLSISCRKSVQITLPLKSQMSKGMSLSDKKPTVSSKIDKIDELSSKLQQYLMKNAEKIEYSKNFTEKVGPNKFNRLLAL